MLVIPAIDLRHGRCVRLFQGDFSRETEYSTDPVEVARRWIELGAERLHVVDLDGARSGRPEQLSLIQAICALGVPVQLGGGLRGAEHVREAFGNGVDRVILGTAAIERPELIDQAIDEFGAGRVVLGVDARNGYVAVRGWEQTSELLALDIISDSADRGIERVVYTDIDRDGTLSQPNYQETARVGLVGPAVIASGGVARWSDLEQLASIPNVEAAIVGRALYDGTIDISATGSWRVGEVAGQIEGADEHTQCHEHEVPWLEGHLETVQDAVEVVH
jgi:phosphoribosylformimino-5-aminoimidazole carboxamide ribotide isomerase